MKSLLLTSFAVFTLGGSSAWAADALAPMAEAPVASWTGCYIGGNVGGGWSHVDQTQVGKVDGTIVNNDYGSGSGSGFIGGAQLGCDYQMDRWVFGVQGMFDFGDIKSSHALTAFPAFDLEDKVKDLFTVTGRAGYLFDPAVLGYVKAGGAWAHVDSAVYGSSFLSESADYDRLGWTVGVGAEWKFASNWSVFGEYNYMDFGKHDVSYNLGPTAVGVPDVVSTKLTVQQVLVGLNYRF
ncbi:porin family protein [Mesorhizobium sp. M7A.F.Ca.US.006.01.1.1]|uniref:outer membrane protein n=1 Tax=Mesorhizobium sp. M7A.F.Ca.US.006.01.1.1 TaxID=2496707 RepID=UPI000FCCB461|nr:outer membrane protein [Mesorhizobium sp. M7A.F.Ca.US.006.01.1.1]RUZ80177.1 porin family protein [Mesorhizobium sp. M7A.F.Ca.US.006.01.1.1]